MRQTVANSTSDILVLKKAAAILGVFSFQDRNLTLSALAQRSGLPKSTTHRILQTLQQLDWVVSRQDQTYSLGPGLIELGGIARTSLDWREVLAPHLNSLSAQVRHAVLVATLVDDHLLYVDKRESHYPLRITSHLGQRRTPHFGAIGKVLMAYLPESEVQRLLDKFPLEPLASGTVVDRAVLYERLKSVHAKGYDIETNEIIDGVVGVAAPIFAGTSQPIAALGVAVPQSLLGPEGIDPIVTLVVATAREVSNELGTKVWPPELAASTAAST